MGRTTSRILVSSLFALFLIGNSAFAAQVSKVKGKGVLINLSGEAAMPGDKYFAVNAAGRKKAIIQIMKVKGNQALGRVTAGAAGAGMNLVRSGSGGGGSSRNFSRNDNYGGGSNDSGKGYLRSKSYWGAMIGYGMDSMSVDLTTGGTASMSGSALSLNGFFDYKMFERIWFRGMFGYQGFAAKSSQTCGTGSCDVNISYIDFSFLGRYLFTDSAYRPWAGLGFDLIFPASKSSTALDSSSINTTGVIVIAAGLDWSINQRMYVPISLEYGLFPHSSSVNADWITLRVGVAWPF